MTKFVFLLFMLANYFCPCFSTIIVQHQSDLIKLLKKNNNDIKLLSDRAGLGEYEVTKYRGEFYPKLNLAAKYSDDHLKPFIDFQSQRTRYSLYSAEVSQKMMLGTKLSVGLTNDNTKLYGLRSSTSNVLETRSFNRPIAFIEFNLDVSKNLFGKIDRNKLEILAMSAKNNQYNLLNGEQLVYFQGISFLWNIRIQNEIIDDVMKYLERLKELEASTITRLERKIAEPGELYTLKATIAAKKAEILGINRRIQNVNSAMKNLVSSEDEIIFQPIESLDSAKKKIVSSEDEVLSMHPKNKFNSSFINIAKNNTAIAAKESENSKLDSLPDIILFSRYAQTGTNPDISRSYQDLYRAKNPQYSAGINFSWPISSPTYKSKRAIGEIKYNISSIRQSKLQKELEVRFSSLKKDIIDLRFETGEIDEAFSSSIKLLEDLYIRYKQGRVSLFELVTEEGKLLEIRVRRKNLWMDRINLLISFYSSYDLCNYKEKFI